MPLSPKETKNQKARAENSVVVCEFGELFPYLDPETSSFDSELVT